VPDQYITVVSRKYDLSIQRRWECQRIERGKHVLVLRGEFEETVKHPHLGTIEIGTISTEYFWMDRWYSVFRFQRPSGELRNFYCNVNVPPKFDGAVLDYIDLDIDLIVWPNGRVVTLDEDEFALNAARYCYPTHVRTSALHALDQLKQLVENREFPFETL
jgi:uncharacterized protein